MNEVETNLREIGILVEIETESKTNTRIIVIRKFPPEPPASSKSQNQAQTALQIVGDNTGDAPAYPRTTLAKIEREKQVSGGPEMQEIFLDVIRVD